MVLNYTIINVCGKIYIYICTHTKAYTGKNETQAFRYQKTEFGVWFWEKKKNQNTV